MLVEYNPSLRGNLPPGAEEFNKALSVYRKEVLKSEYFMSLDFLLLIKKQYLRIQGKSGA